MIFNLEIQDPFVSHNSCDSENFQRDDIFSKALW